MDKTRRSILLGTSALLGSVAGCIGDDGPTRTDPESTPTADSSSTDNPPKTGTASMTPRYPESDWHIRPDEDGNPIDPLQCEITDFARQGRWIEEGVAWGTLSTEGEVVYTLRVRSLTYALGETVNIAFRNISNEVRSTGNPHKMNIDVLTTDGWMDVRGWPDGTALPVTDELVELEPGEAHEWNITLTTDGVIDASFPSHHEEITVCPDLQPGRYRFGFAATQLGGVAVAFDVTAG